MRHLALLTCLLALALVNSSQFESGAFDGVHSHSRNAKVIHKRGDEHKHGKVMQFLHDKWQKFKSLYKKKYSTGESAKRFVLFVKTVKLIIEINDHDSGFKAEVNRFTDMTDDEKEAETGLNVTEYDSFQSFKSSVYDIQNELPNSLYERAGYVANKRELEKRKYVAPQLDWVELGMTLRPLEQGKCQSCWAFSTVSVIESRYAMKTGKLKRFSIQELLDCSYEYKGKDSGCSGGWFSKAYKYVKTGRHLTLDKHLKYNKMDGKCTAGRLPNALKAADMVDYKTINNPSFDQMVVALQGGPISVAVKTTSSMFQYSVGIYKNEKCPKTVNHGMVSVGYSSKFLILRNSWGWDWGQSGYVYFTRLHGNMCGILRTLYYAEFELNNKFDDDDEEESENASGMCKDDDVEKCDEHKFADCGEAMTSNFMKSKCKATCQICKADFEGDCPPGTAKCGTVCMHPSFCN